MAAWATRAVPLAVSGRLAVVVAIQGERVRVVATLGSMLARGYLDSMDVFPGSRVMPRRFHDVLSMLGRERERWLAPWHLSPVPPDMAVRLIWGLYTTSLVLGTLDPVRVPAPALGLVPPPRGTPDRWLAEFLGRFGPEQRDVARELARCRDAWEGVAADRPDADAAVSFELHVRTPLALRAALERLPELRPYRAPDQYMWLRHERGPTLEARMQPRIAGIVQMNAGTLVANVASAVAAAELAARLEDLTAGNVAVRACTWYPHEPADLRRRHADTSQRPALHAGHHPQ